MSRLEQIANDFDEINKKKEEVKAKKGELQAIRSKACKGILAAKADGSLEALADQMENMTQDVTRASVIIEQATDMTGIKDKARSGLLAAYRSGELEVMFTAFTQNQLNILVSIIQLSINLIFCLVATRGFDEEKCKFG